MTELREIAIPMGMFTNDQLGGLDAAARMYYENGFQALGILIGQMAEHEIERRAWNRLNPDQQRESAYGSLNDDHWSDKDVAESLRALYGLEKTERPELGELADELMDVFLQIAYERLCNSDDSRNCHEFEVRNQSNA